MNQLLHPNDVAKRLSISRVTLWRMVRDGHFPAPGLLSPGKPRWSEAVVAAWLAERFGEAVVATPKAALSPMPHHH